MLPESFYLTFKQICMFVYLKQIFLNLISDVIQFILVTLLPIHISIFFQNEYLTKRPAFTSIQYNTPDKYFENVFLPSIFTCLCCMMFLFLWNINYLKYYISVYEFIYVIIFTLENHNNALKGVRDRRMLSYGIL